MYLKIHSERPNKYRPDSIHGELGFSRSRAALLFGGACVGDEQRSADAPLTFTKSQKCNKILSPGPSHAAVTKFSFWALFAFWVSASLFASITSDTRKDDSVLMVLYIMDWASNGVLFLFFNFLLHKRTGSHNTSKVSPLSPPLPHPPHDFHLEIV
jgi:hypothetical protein